MKGRKKRLMKKWVLKKRYDWLLTDFGNSWLERRMTKLLRRRSRDAFLKRSRRELGSESRRCASIRTIWRGWRTSIKMNIKNWLISRRDMRHFLNQTFPSLIPWEVSKRIWMFLKMKSLSTRSDWRHLFSSWTTRTQFFRETLSTLRTKRTNSRVSRRRPVLRN